MSELKGIKLAEQVLKEKTEAAAAAAVDAAKEEADADAAIEKAQAAVTKAIADNDVSLYMEEKGRLEMAQARKDMQAARKQMASGALISQEEYISLVEGIKADIKAKSAETAEKIAAAAENLYSIGKELQDEANNANMLMARIRRQLFANQDVVRNGVIERFKELDSAPFEVARWGMNLKDNYMYKNTREGGSRK